MELLCPDQGSSSVSVLCLYQQCLGLYTHFRKLRFKDFENWTHDRGVAGMGFNLGTMLYGEWL